MDIKVDQVVTDCCTLREGYLHRDGFVFTFGQSNPPVFDRLVIRSPQRTRANEGRMGYSYKTLDEHIELINRFQLKKVMVICDDLSFITQCPSITDICVFPSYDANQSFDYSPLYQLPNLKHLDCKTIYGTHDQYQTTVDYSKLPGLTHIAMVGAGHIGYSTLPELRELWMSGNREHTSFETISHSTELQEVTLFLSGLCTLDGIDKHRKLKSLVLYNNYGLKDITMLRSVADSLAELVIENSSKIQDFSALDSLVNLEHLQLYGNNVLPNLNFLQKMTRLKTFTFTMNVEDGDLNLCMNLPYASCKNRRHYNLKDSKLPKNLIRRTDDSTLP